MPHIFKNKDNRPKERGIEIKNENKKYLKLLINDFIFRNIQG